MDYTQQLATKMWDRRRLEILYRDKHTCVRCGFSDRELHVHHNKYIYGRSAWEYEGEYLETLCDICHYYEHAEFVKLEDILKLKDKRL